MSPTRYDRPELIRQLACLDDHEGLAICGVKDPGFERVVHGLDVRDVAFRWLSRVVVEAAAGRFPDLSAFPGLVVTGETPSDDFRVRVYKRAYEQFAAFGEAGLVVGTALPGRPHQEVVLLQCVMDGEATHVRLNGAVSGIAWVWPREGWMDVGFELAAFERQNTAHITVLNGFCHGEPAALVYWNFDAAVIRSDTDKGLIAKMSRSIGVPGAQARYEGLGREARQAGGEAGLDGLAADIRWAFFETTRANDHPETRGTRMVDLLETARQAGLPSRGSGSSVLREADLSYEEDEGGAGIFERTSHPGSPVEDEAISNLHEPDERLLALERVAGPDETKLLAALREGWQRDPHKSLKEIATDHAWDPHDVEAILKRLQRRAKKIG